MSPWDVELLLTRDALSRRGIAKDAERGLVRGLRRGVYVRTGDLADLSREEQHIVAIRAALATSTRPLVLSHWSAAVLHGLDVLGDRLDLVHVTFDDEGARGLERVASHLFDLDAAEVVEVHGLLVTAPGRTVVDVAGAGTFDEGVVIADAALRAGLSKETLALAVDLAGPRRATRRIAEAVRFADGDSGSAGESVSRVTMHRMGLRPELQRRFSDHLGLIGRSDFFFPHEEVIGEFDGRVKFVDPRYAPDGAAAKLWDEKRREDRLRARSKGFARWGWPEARDPRRLAPILRAAGVRIPRRF